MSSAIIIRSEPRLTQLQVITSIVNKGQAVAAGVLTSHRARIARLFVVIAAHVADVSMQVIHDHGTRHLIRHAIQHTAFVSWRPSGLWQKRNRERLV